MQTKMRWSSTRPTLRIKCHAQMATSTWYLDLLKGLRVFQTTTHFVRLPDDLSNNIICAIEQHSLATKHLKREIRAKQKINNLRS
jgi:hypothetical protein